MEAVEKMFLQAVKASVEDKQVQWEDKLPPEEWLAFFQLAEAHHVLPMVYEAVYSCPAAQKSDQQFFARFKKRTMQAVLLQAVKTSEFLSMMQHLKSAGINPCVIKGIVCRELYPNPDFRMSSDEDLLISDAQFQICHRALLDYGMSTSELPDLNSAYEISYQKQGSPLYIELHKSLFPTDSDAYGNLNSFFTGIDERLIEIQVQGTTLLTMDYTDHLFYLICHALKHFLHSGFGIRQVCDIVLFANCYGSEIDWNCMLKNCREICADQFAATLFQIGQKYLTFDPEKACYPEVWQEIQVDEQNMLSDILRSGIYGGINMSRKHSSGVTLNAVSAQKQGKRAGNSILKTVFPPAKALKNRFPYLEKHPYLLPMAWISRILSYQKELRTTSGNHAADSIKIGNQRVALLKQYGIIKK